MRTSAAAAFYRQLASLLRAGLTLAQALEHAGAAAGGEVSAKAKHWAAACADGSQFHEQLSAEGESQLAISLVAAGEKSGRLPELCDRLADLAEHHIKLRGMIIGRLIYPALLIHAALAAPGLVRLFTEGSAAAAITPILIFWGLLVLSLATFWFTRRTGLASRLALLRGPRSVTLPLLTANTCMVIEAGLAAGMLFHECLELAAPACGNRTMAARLKTAAGDLLHGRRDSLALALGDAGFPPTVVQLLSSAEIGGTLDASLRRAATWQLESFTERSLWAARILTGVIYAAAMLMVAWAVLSMFGAYLQQLNQIAEE